MRFDLGFEEIKSISQKAGAWTGEVLMLAKQSYALKFEPRGLAPNYAVMDLLMCSAGEKAELTVTKNLGQYIIHVIDNSSIKTELADPSKAKGPSSGWLTALVTMGLRCPRTRSLPMQLPFTHSLPHSQALSRDTRARLPLLGPVHRHAVLA
jgi:hypothetical protein